MSRFKDPAAYAGSSCARAAGQVGRAALTLNLTAPNTPTRKHALNTKPATIGRTWVCATSAKKCWHVSR